MAPSTPIRTAFLTDFLCTWPGDRFFGYVHGPMTCFIQGPVLYIQDFKCRMAELINPKILIKKQSWLLVLMRAKRSRWRILGLPTTIPIAKSSCTKTLSNREDICRLAFGFSVCKTDARTLAGVLPLPATIETFANSLAIHNSLGIASN